MDPLYGKTYLPRKFKTAFAIPPLNDIDIFTNDLGFIVIAENAKQFKLKSGGSLRDISPTILGMLGLPEPKEMTGADLRLKIG